MHQTISGVTHKTKIFEKEKIKNFILEEKKKYFLFKGKNFIYKNKINIESCSLNYLNDQTEKTENTVVKNLIRLEFDDCESIYPYAGDLFIDLFFSEKNIKKSLKSFKFNKKLLKDFFSTIKDENVLEISKIFFNNFSLENNVSVEKYFEKDIKIVKENDIKFDLNFDNDFYNKDIKINNYKIIILDGFIQSVGEIHHLLTDSNQNKKNYVIFCYGMSEDVKQTIIKNNKLKKTYVYPISFTLSEENLNILNDISVLHSGANVINVQSSQSISQIFSRKELINSGKSITIKNGSFSFEPTCCKKSIEIHRKFIKNRIEETTFDQNKEFLRKRLQRISMNNINLYIPDIMWRQNNFIRDLDYVLRFFGNCKSSFVKYYTTDKKNFYYFPLVSILEIDRKIKSFRSKIENIEKFLTYS